MSEIENISLSLTEDRLSNDVDGQFKQQIIQSLKKEVTELTASKQGGLSPDEFQHTEALIKALGCAIKVTEVTWLKFSQSFDTH